MPDDLVDHWDAPPRRKNPGREARGTLGQALGRWMPRTIGPALVAASATLLAGQLFSAYRTVWPADIGGQDQPGGDFHAMRLSVAITGANTAPLILASIPVLTLALLALRSPVVVAVGRTLRRVAANLSFAIALVGVVVFVGTTAWTIVTRGQVDDPGGGIYRADPVSTFLSRGGDGLATAVLAAVAGWLLSTRSAADVTAAPESAAVASGVEVQASLGDEAAVLPTPLPEDTRPAPLADPAYRLGSVAAGSPAPFVTRGASEPSWQQTDATVFRRPSGGTDHRPESTPDDAVPTSKDPALIFRRPTR